MQTANHFRTISFTHLFIWSILFLTLPVSAQQVGNWAGYLAENAGEDYFDFPLNVTHDGTVTIVTTVDSALLSQFNSTRVLDEDGYTIAHELLMTSPRTFSVPLAAGSFTVRIARAHFNGYGNFAITATLAAANGGATETENNDVISAASTNPNGLFSGAIGHWRKKDLKDLSDYHVFTLAGDTDIHFDLAADGPLLDFDTVLTLRTAGDVGMAATYITSTNGFWDLHLAPGTFYLRLFTHDYGRYGGYTFTGTMTPAVALSSETENNDALGLADPIAELALQGSIGYYRDKDGQDVEYYDNQDYFSCEVRDGGTLTVKVVSDASLHCCYNNVSIRDAANIVLDYEYLRDPEAVASATNLSAGTYYIRIGRAGQYGAYQVDVSGDVIIKRALDLMGALPNRGGWRAILPLGPR